MGVHVHVLISAAFHQNIRPATYMKHRFKKGRLITKIDDQKIKLTNLIPQSAKKGEGEGLKLWSTVIVY